PEVGQILSPGQAEGTPTEGGEGAQRAGEDEPAAGDQAANGEGSTSGSPFSQLTGAFEQARNLLGEYGLQFARTLLGSAGTTLAGLTAIVFLTLLMLVEQPLWRAKVETL